MTWASVRPLIPIHTFLPSHLLPLLLPLILFPHMTYLPSGVKTQICQSETLSLVLVFSCALVSSPGHFKIVCGSERDCGSLTIVSGSVARLVYFWRSCLPSPASYPISVGLLVYRVYLVRCLSDHRHRLNSHFLFRQLFYYDLFHFSSSYFSLPVVVLVWKRIHTYAYIHTYSSSFSALSLIFYSPSQTYLQSKRKPSGYRIIVTVTANITLQTLNQSQFLSIPYPSVCSYVYANPSSIISDISPFVLER